MANTWICPICGREYSYNELKNSGKNETCWRQSSGSWGYEACKCKEYNVTLIIESYILDDMEHKPELRERILNLALEHTLRSEFCKINGRKHRWHYYYDDSPDAPKMDSLKYVNIAKKMKDYPISPVDVANRGLMNLSLCYPEYGSLIGANRGQFRLFYRKRDSDDCAPYRFLEDFGYVKESHIKYWYIITAAGWQKIEELRKNEQVVRQGFIAMIFREEANSIREAFRKAIEEMNYHAVIMDEKEHNNQIVPEIFYEIKRSKFAVVDVTFPSLGAYYEAGYAQALDKEVIVCCREDIFNDPEKRPHFDIAQKAIITWKDEEELVAKLKRRIEATVT